MQCISFLDLEIQLDPAGVLSTNIYEKALNLYLYLPLHLSHSLGFLRSLINGFAYRVFILCRHDNLRDVYLRWCFERLVARGHSATLLQRLFKQAFSWQRRSSNNTIKAKQKILICHVTYHNCGPTTMDIQWQFINTVTQPSNECLARDIKNQCRGSFDPKLLVLLHWTKNLGNCSLLGKSELQRRQT